MKGFEKDLIQHYDVLSFVDFNDTRFIQCRDNSYFVFIY